MTFSKLAIMVAVLGAAVAAQGTTVNIYADAGPSGGSAFTTWQANAYAAAASGTFVNMANGGHPGTTTFNPTDAIVYNTGDHGKRLYWVVYIPGETATSMAGRIQVKDVADWDGFEYEGGYNPDGPNVGWTQPAGQNYNGGFVYTFGNSWYSDDNNALPYNTDDDPFNEVDADDIAAMADSMLYFQTHWNGMVRYRDTLTSPWQYTQLNLTLVPEPASLTLLALGGLAVLGRRRRTR